MAKTSTKWMFFLVAVVVVVGVNGQQDRRASKVFPPEEDYDRGGYRGYGGYGGYGDREGGKDRRDYGRGGYRGYGGYGDREGGKDRRASKVFPPEEDYGRGGYRGYGDRGGYGGYGGGDEDRRAGKVFPPEEQRGGRGGRVFPPEEERGGGTGEPEGGGRRGWAETRPYILSDSRRVIATDAGGMRVVRGVGGRFRDSPMHIGFITMEPNSMFIPQYLDSSLILFVEIGEARIGSIYKDNLVEKDLKAGDLYRIQAGSPFYIVNIAQGQRLHIITSIDTAESIDWSSFESFALGGGTNPRSVLDGFDKQTLATAFNVSHDTIDELLSSRQEGAIVFLNPDSESTDQPSKWKRFLELGPNERKTRMKGIVNNVGEKIDEDVEMSPWSVRNLWTSLFGENKDDDLDSYNIYGDKADFKNDYGWSLEVNGDDYKPLRLSDFAVYLVNLTAGSMMAPHINPTATEYGVVLSGTGNIQVVFPNGTLAMDAQVNEGDVFWIPRYFPFCQVASRSSPFVFFGFSTSARNNRPQFLAGQGSVLQTMMGPGVAAAFGLSEERMAEIINAQSQSTILPSVTASPGGGGGEIPQGEGQGDPAQGRGKGDPAQGRGKGDPAQGKGKGDRDRDEQMGSKIGMKNSSE